jgi:hypothetical protein
MIDLSSGDWPLADVDAAVAKATACGTQHELRISTRAYHYDPSGGDDAQFTARFVRSINAKLLPLQIKELTIHQDTEDDDEAKPGKRRRVDGCEVLLTDLLFAEGGAVAWGGGVRVLRMDVWDRWEDLREVCAAFPSVRTLALGDSGFVPMGWRGVVRLKALLPQLCELSLPEEGWVCDGACAGRDNAELVEWVDAHGRLDRLTLWGQMHGGRMGCVRSALVVARAVRSGVPCCERAGELCGCAEAGDAEWTFAGLDNGIVALSLDDKFGVADAEFAAARLDAAAVTSLIIQTAERELPDFPRVLLALRHVPEVELRCRASCDYDFVCRCADAAAGRCDVLDLGGLGADAEDHDLLCETFCDPSNPPMPNWPQLRWHEEDSEQGTTDTV